MASGHPDDKLAELEALLFVHGEPLTLKKISVVLGLEKGEYVLVTIHRTENTENLEILGETFSALNKLSGKTKLVFSLHPRTKKIMEKHNLKLNKNITVIEPQPYLTFLALLQDCRFCMSDSGGIQEEAPSMGVPVVVLRNETERLEAVESGLTAIAGLNPQKIVKESLRFLKQNARNGAGHKNPYGDGRSSQRIISILSQLIKNKRIA